MRTHLPLACQVVVMSLLTAPARPAHHPVGLFRTVIAPDKSFPAQTSFPVTNEINACRCQMRCLVQRSCAAWTTLNVTEGQLECRLAHQGPDQLQPSPQPSAVYGYRLASLTSLTGVLEGDDNRVYMVGKIKMNLYDSRNFCGTIPGFRLAILKTERQLQDGLSLAAQHSVTVLVNLEKVVENTLEWGDGTRVPSVFHNLYFGNIGGRNRRTMCIKPDNKIVKSRDKEYPLCQGKDDDTVW